jgi:CBS domain containing-hemolysin-like protein
LLALLAAALFILLNGFFVAAEFAFVKVRATQLDASVERGDKSGIAAKVVIGRLDRYLSVTQFGITLASLGLGWLGEPALESIIDGLVGKYVQIEGHEAIHFAIVGVSFTLLTFSHVLFGELVPKLIAIQRSAAMALSSALPLRFLYFAFWPFLFVLEHSSRIVLRVMGLKPDAASEGSLSADEIVGILAANTALGPGGKEMGQIVERVMRFAQRNARSAMVPRVDVVAIPVEASGAEAITAVRTHQFSRMVLTRGRSLDEVVGYLYTKDLLFNPGAERLPNVSVLRREILFVPESQSLVNVMRDMQKENTPIAVVVDEYGGTSGIVTLEDILEEIVGDIRDEFDEEPARITALPGEEKAWEVDGRTLMEELRSLGVPVSEDDAAEPVGAVVLDRLGRLARLGDRVPLTRGAVAEVVVLHRRRVARVRVRLVPASEAPPASPSR